MRMHTPKTEVTCRYCQERVLLADARSHLKECSPKVSEAIRESVADKLRYSEDAQEAA